MNSDTKLLAIGTFCHEGGSNLQGLRREFFLWNFMEGLGIDRAVGVFGLNNDVSFSPDLHSQKLALQPGNDPTLTLSVGERISTLAGFDNLPVLVSESIFECYDRTFFDHCFFRCGTASGEEKHKADPSNIRS